MSQEPSSPFIEPLRDAFAAFALDSTSPPTPLPPNGHGRQLADFNSALTRRRYSEGQREYNLEFQEPNPTLSGRHITLSDLWADPQASQTMSLLHSQFVNDFDVDPSQLRVEDYVKLFRQNFRDLNEEVVRDNMLFVEYVQEHELRQQEEEHLRRLREGKEQQVQSLNTIAVLPHRETHELPFKKSLSSTTSSVFVDSGGQTSRTRSQLNINIPFRHLPACPEAAINSSSPCRICGSGIGGIGLGSYQPAPQTSINQNVSEYSPTRTMISPSQVQLRDYETSRRMHPFHESQ